MSESGEPDSKSLSERLAGKAGSAPVYAKRFYTAATVREITGSSARFAVELDGRAVKTPKKLALELPSHALAEAICQEWRAQDEVIKPQSMPLTRIANTAIDAVSAAMDQVAADIVHFSGSDLLCYRADAPSALVDRQSAAWDPVLDWARTTLKARFVLGQGIVPVEQPPVSLEKIAEAIARYDAFRLSALHIITTLTGSALLAVAFAHDAIGSDAVWAAAHIDEDWQAEQWGPDEEAAARRQIRKAEFDAAVTAFTLAAAP